MISFRKSIGIRLFAIIIIILALHLLVDSFILIQKSYHNRLEIEKNHIASLARLRLASLHQLQPGQTPILNVLHHFLNLDSTASFMRNEKMHKKLVEASVEGGFLDILLVDISSDHHYHIVEAVDQQAIGQDVTHLLNQNDPFLPENIARGYTVYFNMREGKEYFAIAQPIFSEKEKKYVGILMVNRQVTDQLQAILAPEKIGYTINFALLTPASLIVASSDPTLHFQYLKPLSLTHTEASKFFAFEWNQERQFAYKISFKDTDYALMAYTSERALLRGPLLQFFYVYGIYGLIFIIGSLVAYFFTRFMTQPIENIRVVMEKIGGGDFSARYQSRIMGYEINTLGNIFNEMVETILKNKQEAEEEKVKKEIFSNELKLAQHVQNDLLPQKMPDFPGVDLAAAYIPAILVGGDFYECFSDDQHTLLTLAIGDASGKGVQACFFSLSLLNVLRIFAKEFKDVAKTLAFTNRLFCEDTKETGMFITLLLGMYDPSTKILSYFSCGHNPLLLRRKDGSVFFLNHGAMAIGVISELNIETHHFQLEAGDTLLFYTDGITEAHDEQFELFGEERLKLFLQQEGDKKAAEIVHKLTEAVKAFAGKAPQHDDITLLVMKVKDD